MQEIVASNSHTKIRRLAISNELRGELPPRHPEKENKRT